MSEVSVFVGVGILILSEALLWGFNLSVRYYNLWPLHIQVPSTADVESLGCF